MAIGNMGPRKKPMNETAMALPIRDGINHIVNSKLFDLKKSSVYNFGNFDLKLTQVPEMHR